MPYWITCNSMVSGETFYSEKLQNSHGFLKFCVSHCRSGSLQRGSSIDPGLEQACHASFALRQSSYRVGEDCISERLDFK